MHWLDTRTHKEALELQERMWGLELREGEEGSAIGVRGEGLDEGGEFWADAIRRLKDKPKDRLAMARRHLPLPGAFREAAIALRSIVRQKRKLSVDFRPELKELHHLAAIWSFYIPYAPDLNQPGFNVMAVVPYSEFEQMSLDWDSIGFDKLELLTKTDKKMMVDAWGTPKTHTTANLRYEAIWRRYQSMLIESEAAQLQQLRESLRSLANADEQRTGFLSKLLGR